MPASDEEVEYFVKEILSRAARRGVFHEDLLTYRPSTLSKTDAARAIRIAKERGLYAVPEMSHHAYGTWYRCDSTGEGGQPLSKPEPWKQEGPLGDGTWVVDSGREARDLNTPAFVGLRDAQHLRDFARALDRAAAALEADSDWPSGEGPHLVPED